MSATITSLGGAGGYQITGSKRVHVDVILDLSGGQGAEAEFTVSFPIAAAPTITLVSVTGGGTQPITFAAAPPDPSPAFATRTVAVTHADAAGTRTFTLTIGDPGSSPVDRWTLALVFAAPAASVTAEPSLHVTALTVEADPILDCPPLPATVSAGQAISLVGRARRNTAPLPTAASYTSPAPVLTWTQTAGATTIVTAGALTAMNVGSPSAPGVGVTATTAAPGVAGALTYQFTAAFGDFTDTFTGTVQVQAVNHRWMVALDRSKTMTGTKWTSATTAANLWVDVVSAFRLPNNAQDSIGVLTFDDSSTAGFRGSGVDPAVQVRWPGAAMGALRSVTDASMDGLTVGGAPALGGPANQTPLGDGLVTSIDAMVAATTTAADLYDLAVFSDGVENSGSVKVDPASGISTAAAAHDFDAEKNTGARSALVFGTGASANTKVYPIGPISPAPVNPAPLAVLGSYGLGSFPMPAGVRDVLPTAFGSALLPRLGAANVVILPDDTLLNAPDPVSTANKQVYFKVPAGDDKLAIAVLCDNVARDKTLHLLWRTQQDSGGFDPVLPAAALTRVARDGYLFAVVDLTQVTAVATEWRLSVTKAGTPSTTEDIAKENVFAGRDLNVRSEITFDRDSYYNDEPMVVRGSVFADRGPVKDVKISVEVEGPAISDGELLAANARVAEPPLPADAPDSRDAALTRVLASRKQATLPTVSYKSVFIDGTNELQPDRAAAGHYGNVFAKGWREGRYDFRFTIAGKTAEGGSFVDAYRTSRMVKIRADDASSPVTVSGFDARAPKGLRAARVTVTPTDAMGQRLGPYRSSDVVFTTSSGTFVGDVESAYDGSYSQSLLFAATHRPVVTVQVQGRSFTPVVAAPGLIGFITMLVRRAFAWLVRYARRG